MANKYPIQTITALSNFIIAEIQQAQLEKHKLVLLISGGSFLPVFNMVAQQLISQKITLDQITLSVTDERYSSDWEDPQSNFTQLLNLPEVRKLSDLGLHFFPILQEGLSLAEATNRFSTFIATSLREKHTRVIAVVGVGADGHIAGILPHRSEQGNSFFEELIVGYDTAIISTASNPYRERITLSFRALAQIDQVALFAQGPEDYSFIDRFNSDEQADRNAVASTPVLFLKTLGGLMIYADALVHS